MEDGGSHFPTEIIIPLALVFAPLAFGSTESWSRAALAGFFSLLFLLRFRAFGLPGLLAQPYPPIFWPMLALIVLALVQALNPTSPLALAMARGPFTTSPSETLQWVFDWSLYAAIILILPVYFRGRGSASLIAWVLLVTGALVAIFGIAQQQAGNEFYYGLRPVSAFRMPFGPFPNKNHAGAYLSICAMAGAGLIGSAIERYRELQVDGRRDEFFARLSIGIALEFLILFGLLQTRSRGALIAAASSGTAALFLYWISSKAKPKLPVLMFVVGAGALISGVIHFTGADISSYIPIAGENSLTFRYAMVGDGIKIIASFPAFGTGLGALRAIYPLWTDPVMAGYFTDHLHCDPVELAAEAGLPMAVLYYAAFLATLTRCLGLTSGGDRTPNAQTIAFSAAAGTFLLHQVLEFPTHIPALHLTALVCLAAAWGQQVMRPLPETPARPPSRAGVYLAATVVSIFWLVNLTPRAVACYFDFLAGRYPSPSKQYYEFLANRWEPTPERSLRLAGSHLKLADENPPARQILLRTALRHSLTAYDADPLSSDVRRTHASVLWALGRRRDARLIVGME